MNHIKFPNNPDAQRWYERTVKRVRAENGSIDVGAFGIIQSIFINKNPQLHGRFGPMGKMEDGINILLSVDPLYKEEKNRILDAVRNFDRSFLRDLIRAMDLCEYGLGVADPNGWRVIQCHSDYVESTKADPNCAQLRMLMKRKHPKLTMDERTLRSICKRVGLKLSRGKMGRPNKKSEKQKKPRPI